jgi:hypothetical protein
MTREEAEEIILESNPTALFMDGFDEAILGIGERPNFGPIVVYDESKIIAKLATEMEPDEDDFDTDDIQDAKHQMAVEYYEFNIKCAWLGEGTPLIVRTDSEF